MIFILLAAFFFLVAGVLAFIATVWAISIAIRKGRSIIPRSIEERRHRCKWLDADGHIRGEFFLSARSEAETTEVAELHVNPIPRALVNYNKIREAVTAKPPGYSYVDKILESDLIGDE